MKDFELLSHTADIKVRVYGKKLGELFSNAVIGMFQAIGPISSECTKKNDRLICSSLPIEHIVEIKAPRLDILLVDFLSEALYLSDINDEAYLDVDVKEISEDHINAVLRGIAVEGFEVVEIKAVTYHDLEIIQTEQGYQVDIVFDI